MMTQSITKIDIFRILDEKTREIHHGCNQNWYTTVWQRLSGCGPSVASNLIFYLFHERFAIELGTNPISKKSFLDLMEEIWEYVTPTIKGISTTRMFFEAVLSYAKSKGLEIQYHVLDIPKNKANRPTLTEVIHFLKGALSQDAPVAFLNLCNGDEKDLDEWHWVTIISLESTENEDQVLIDILDEGQIKKINLGLWYLTTTKGGGFVYFTAPSSR
jgi:hypothetical protein